MSKHPQAKPANDAAQALHAALGAWLNGGIDADPVARSRALDALAEAQNKFRYETLWERRRLVLEMGADHTLRQISNQIKHSVAALHQWKTGDRRACATGRFVNKTTKPRYISPRTR